MKNSKLIIPFKSRIFSFFTRQACKGQEGVACDCSGIKGLEGESGFQGQSGLAGDPGDTGPDGPFGPKGERGNYGEFGGSGEKGTRVSCCLKCKSIFVAKLDLFPCSKNYNKGHNL